MSYGFCTDFMELISGESNQYSKAYTEAVKETDDKSPKGEKRMKNLVTEIEGVAGKVRDARITASRGDITKFKGYENIKTIISFIQKNMPSAAGFSDLKSIFEHVQQYRDLYQQGYSRNVRLVVLEYENVVYILVTGLAMIMCTEMDMAETENGIKVVKKSGVTLGVIGKTIRDISKQLGGKNHRDYLEALVKGSQMSKGDMKGPAKPEPPEKEPPAKPINESVFFTEGAVMDTVQLMDLLLYNVSSLASFAKRTFIGLRQSLFGIVPLVRSVLYLRYKKKADTIAALESQCKFIAENIERLQNVKNMDPKKKAVIIKKQKAYIEAYRKRAEKLRAQLCEGERDSTTHAAQEQPKISNTGNDDDLVLEYVGVNPEALGDTQGFQKGY